MHTIKLPHPTNEISPYEYFSESKLASLAYSIMTENGVSEVKFYKHFGTEHTATTIKYNNFVSVKVIGSGTIYQY